MDKSGKNIFVWAFRENQSSASTEDYGRNTTLANFHPVNGTGMRSSPEVADFDWNSMLRIPPIAILGKEVIKNLSKVLTKEFQLKNLKQMANSISFTQNRKYSLRNYRCPDIFKPSLKHTFSDLHRSHEFTWCNFKKTSNSTHIIFHRISTLSL